MSSSPPFPLPLTTLGVPKPAPTHTHPKSSFLPLPFVPEQLAKSKAWVRKEEGGIQPPRCTACGRAPSGSRTHPRGLTLSFWKEWRKLPPSSPSSLGVPGGLLMPLMLFGEFCRRRSGEAVSRSLHPQSTTGQGRGPAGPAPVPTQGPVREEGSRSCPAAHLLLEVHLCLLTLWRGDKRRKALLKAHPQPRLPPAPLLPSTFPPGSGSRGGSRGAHLRIRSCDGAPCRPCRPWGRQSQGPSGTADEKTTPTSTQKQYRGGHSGSG